MEVFLIRHTAPDISPGLIYGHLDVPLLHSVERDRNEIAAQLPVSLNAVYSSPSQRCRLLAAALHAEVIVDERLRELHFGSWEGRTWDNLSPEESAAWMEDYVNTAPPGGETLRAMQARVHRFLDDLHLAPFRQAAVVTHAGVIRIILARMQAIPLRSIFSLEVRYGQVFRIEL